MVPGCLRNIVVKWLSQAQPTSERDIDDAAIGARQQLHRTPKSATLHNRFLEGTTGSLARIEPEARHAIQSEGADEVVADYFIGRCASTWPFRSRQADNAAPVKPAQSLVAPVDAPIFSVALLAAAALRPRQCLRATPSRPLHPYAAGLV